MFLWQHRGWAHNLKDDWFIKSAILGLASSMSRPGEGSTVGMHFGLMGTMWSIAGCPCKERGCEMEAKSLESCYKTTSLILCDVCHWWGRNDRGMIDSLWSSVLQCQYLRRFFTSSPKPIDTYSFLLGKVVVGIGMHSQTRTDSKDPIQNPS